MMNKAKKYKLKLDYTVDELKELRRLGDVCASPMTAVWHVVDSKTFDKPFRNLGAKYLESEHEDDFDFLADITNVVRGTAIFLEKRYVVHDSTTNQYIYYNIKQKGLRWGQPRSGKAEIKTKEEWLAVNPAYELMLERVEDYRQSKNNVWCN